MLRLPMHTKRSNPALDLAPFGRRTLRDKAAQAAHFHVGLFYRKFDAHEHL